MLWPRLVSVPPSNTVALAVGYLRVDPGRPETSFLLKKLAVPGPGTLVMVGAGTAHGVHPLPDGRSPFHFARRRMALVEPPHMHTSMLWVPHGEETPAVGDAVDVQRPLTYVTLDRVVAT